MRHLAILAAAAAIGAAATPAAAQYYPQQPQQQQVPQPYPGQPGYGYNQQQQYPQQQNGLGGIIGQLLGGRNYAANEQQLIAQCAAAAQTEVARRYPANAYGQQQQGYGQPPYGNAYGYNQQGYAGVARVTAITSVERRPNRAFRVIGVVDSGRYGYAQQRQQQQRYGNQAYAQQGDLRFNCNVDYAGRVSNLRLTRLR